MKRIPTLLCAAAASLLAACSGDDGPTPPRDPQLSGTWTYSASNLTGEGLSCTITELTLSIQQRDATRFAGTYTGGTLRCGTSVTATFGGGLIMAGTQAGSDVSFDLNSSDWRNAGTLSGRSITGTTTFRLNTGTRIATFTGPFTAVKQ